MELKKPDRTHLLCARQSDRNAVSIRNCAIDTHFHFHLVRFDFFLLRGFGMRREQRYERLIETPSLSLSL